MAFPRNLSLPELHASRRKYEMASEALSGSDIFGADDE